MLNSKQIADVASASALTYLGEAHFVRAEANTTTDSEGNEAIRLTVVLKPDAVPYLNGDFALDILVDVQDALSKKNEHRLVIVEYATEQELAEDAEENIGA